MFGSTSSGEGKWSEGPDPVKRAEPRGIALLDRAVIGSLVLFALAAPHSIAVTQGAFLLGMVLWVIRWAIRRSLDYRPMVLALPILIFVWLSVFAAIFSYEPALSLLKVRSVGLFLIVFLVAQNLPNREWGKRLALLLIGSCFLNVGYVFWQKAVGRGLRVLEMTEESPLSQAELRPGDVLLEVEGRTVRSLEDVAAAIAPRRGERVRLFIFRPEIYRHREVLVPQDAPSENPLGIRRWEPWKHFRASGFYGWNYFTYAEVVQLIGSLLLGLFLTLPKKRSIIGFLAALGIVAIAYAILLTVTRAVWGAFALSALVMVLHRWGKKALVIALIVLPLAAPVGARFDPLPARWYNSALLQDSQSSRTGACCAPQPGRGRPAAWNGLIYRTTTQNPSSSSSSRSPSPPCSGSSCSSGSGGRNKAGRPHGRRSTTQANPRR